MVFFVGAGRALSLAAPLQDPAPRIVSHSPSGWPLLYFLSHVCPTGFIGGSGPAKKETLPPERENKGPSASVMEKQKALSSLFGGVGAEAGKPVARTPQSDIPRAKKWPVPTDTSVNAGNIGKRQGR